jgi:exosome complex RNA-binding protein Rrp42 (RNase PH superfamily)
MNRATDKEVNLARVVERGIRESKAMDTESLCIMAGEKVWSVRCDVHVTDHGGNLIDCVNLAAVCTATLFTVTLKTMIVTLQNTTKVTLSLSYHDRDFVTILGHSNHYSYR